MKALFLILLLALCISANITTTPYMYMDTDNPKTAIHIHWEGGAGTIHYGLSDYNSTANGTNHVHLTGLETSAKYQWYLVVGTDTSVMGSFQLDPGVGGSFRMVLFADSHYPNYTAVNDFLEYAHSQNPDLIIINGDVLTDPPNGGSTFKNFFNEYPPLFANAIFVPNPGNHDNNRSYWQSYFPYIPQTVLNDSIPGPVPTPITPEHQTARNYMMDYGNITFEINDCHVGGDVVWDYFDLWFWWRKHLNNRITTETLRPMVIGLSHYEAHRSHYMGPVIQSTRGVLWYYGHVHTYVKTQWLELNQSSGATINASDAQIPNAIRYCVPGFVGGSNGLTDARALSVVDVMGDGMIYNKVHKVTNGAGVNTGDHPMVDSFIVNGKSFVDAVKTENIPTLDLNKASITASPNPFNPSTTILINGLQTDKRTIVKIFNINGELIEDLSVMLINNKLEWNAENKTSGVYIVQVITNEKQLSKKIFLKK